MCFNYGYLRVLSPSGKINQLVENGTLNAELLCRNMSQSNISKILNGKVVPRIETLNKIASATHTRLVISFENLEGEDV